MQPQSNKNKSSLVFADQIGSTNLDNLNDKK